MRSLLLLFALSLSLSVLSCDDSDDETPQEDVVEEMREDGREIDASEDLVQDLPVEDTREDPGSEDTVKDEQGDQETDPIEAGVITTRLPSEFGGQAGLALRIRHCASEDARYPEGAPVVVELPGGWTAEGLLEEDLSQATEVDWGYISVSVLLPGGVDGELSSGGVYDYRGENCIGAARDALRFASGALEDMEGKTLQDYLPFALIDEVGVIGRSNGGNLSIVALAEHGDALPNVRYFVAWESPIGDQYAAKELNDNPYLTPDACDNLSCPLPGFAEDLRWDPSAETSPLGIGDLSSAPGGFFADHVDGPYLITSMPIGLGPAPDRPAYYPSVELAGHLRAAGPSLYPDQAPPWLVLSEAEVEEYWRWRDGEVRIPDAAAHFPQLMVIHVQGENDHVQTAIDYPHARGHVQGWIDAGIPFSRLNPDAAYLAMVTGADASALPDNDANISIPFPGTRELTVPSRVDGVPIGNPTAAAILELADRTHFQNTTPNLDAVLTD